MGVIAQGAISVDENAGMAQTAQSIANDANNKFLNFQGFMHGRITQSKDAPNNDTDAFKDSHMEGDLWIQIDPNSHHAIGMYHWTNGSWIQQQWDQSVLNVNTLNGLIINGGVINGGTINGVDINGSSINVDIGSNSAYDAGIDPISWSADGFNPDDPGSSGFHFQNGLMNFKALRTSGNHAGQWDFTFIGPNDLKFRGSKSPDTSHQNINSRTDIRAEYIVTSVDGYAVPTVGGNQDGCMLHSNGYATFTNGIYAPMINAGSSGSLFEIQSGVTTKYNMYAHDFKKKSDLSVKRDIQSLDTHSALAEILGTDIYTYKYKDDNASVNIGPIIDNIHDIDKPEYKTSEYIIDRGEDSNNYLSIANTLGLAVSAIQELSKQNEQLLGKVTRLERLNNGNN